MIHVVQSIQRMPADVVQRYKDFSSATVYEASGCKGALSSRIKPIAPVMKVCGPVVTVKLKPGDNLMLHKAIYVAQPGDVIVADAEGFMEAGAWGELMTTAAKLRGIAGLVFNGAVRDSQAIVDTGFPVFCCGLSIKGTMKKFLGAINHTICIDDVVIDAGDLILGDRDGVVVVERERSDEVLKKSMAREENELKFRERLMMGESTIDIAGLSEVLESLSLK